MRFRPSRPPQLNLPQKLASHPVVILPADVVQIVLLGLSLTSCGGLALTLWASGRDRFSSPSQQTLRDVVTFLLGPQVEPAYAWGVLYAVLAAVMLVGVAFGLHGVITVSLCTMPLPFAAWALLIGIAAINEPKGALTGVAAYSFIACAHVAIATMWIFMLRINPSGVLSTPRRYLIDDVSSRHPVALSCYAALIFLGLLLGPLVIGSASLDDVLSKTLQWQWSIETMVGGLLALTGALLPLRRRLPGLFLERIGALLLVFGCLTYASALALRSGVGAIGPVVLMVALSAGFLFRGVQITMRIRQVTFAATHGSETPGEDA